MSASNGDVDARADRLDEALLKMDGVQLLANADRDLLEGFSILTKATRKEIAQVVLAQPSSTLEPERLWELLALLARIAEFRSRLKATAGFQPAKREAGTRVTPGKRRV